jgi:hypothetical protein
MKNKPFENAITSLQELFSDLSERKVLTDIDIRKFNESQKSIIAYYNFLNSADGSVILPWTDEKFIEAWNIWKTYRKQQHNFRYKSIAEQRGLNRLHCLSEGKVDEAIRLIDLAIDSTWQGFFPDKKKAQAKQNSATDNYKQNLANRLNNNQ